MQLTPPPLRKLPPTTRRFIHGFGLGMAASVALWMTADALWFKIASPLLMGTAFGASYALSGRKSEQSQRLFFGFWMVALVVLIAGAAVYVL